MKITWFADMTFRIQIAGRIIVTYPNGAPFGIDPGELVSGADTVIDAQAPDLIDFDPTLWRPRRRGRLIDEPGDEGVRLYRLRTSGLVADSADEGLLAIDHAASQTGWDRWADNAIVVVCGTGAQCAAQGIVLLDGARPKLIALAITDDQTDAAFDALAPLLGDTSLTVLDPTLAVEI